MARKNHQISPSYKAINIQSIVLFASIRMYSTRGRLAERVVVGLMRLHSRTIKEYGTNQNVIEMPWKRSETKLKVFQSSCMRQKERHFLAEPQRY